MRGVGLGYLNLALALVVGLWLTPFLLGNLGQAKYGLWLVIGQVLLYVSLTDFGVVSVLPRETAYAVGQAGGVAEALPEISRLLGSTLRIIAWQLPIVALVVAVVVAMIPDEWETFRGPLTCLLVVFCLSYPLRIFSAVLNGIQDFAYTGRVQIVTLAFATAITIGLIWIGAGLYALVASWAITQTLPAVMAWLRIRSKFPEAMPRDIPKLSREELKTVVTRGGWVTSSQVTQLLVSGSDLLLVGRILGASAVVPYSITGKLVSVLANHPLLVAEVARPALSEIRMSGSPSKMIDASTALAQSLLLLSGAVACVVLLCNEGFVALWVGSDQYVGFGLTLSFVAVMLLRHLNTTLIYSLFSLGQERWIAKTLFLDGVVGVCLGYGLVSAFGLIGAPIASIASVLLVSLPANLYALGSASGGRPWEYLTALAPWGWRFTLLAIASAIVGTIWTPRSVVAIFIALMAVCSVYAAVMFQVMLRPPVGLYVQPRVQRLYERTIAWSKGAL